MHTEQLLSPSVASVDTVSELCAALQSGELVHRCMLMLVKVAVKRKSAPLKLLSNPLARLTLWPHPVLCCCSQRLRKLSWPGLFLTKQQLQSPSLERGEYWFPVPTSCGWLTFYTCTSICIAFHLLWKKTASFAENGKSDLNLEQVLEMCLFCSEERVTVKMAQCFWVGVHRKWKIQGMSSQKPNR